MPSTTDPDHRGQRRDAILAEAYRQFAVTGFDRTTTASVCRGAGVSSGTFFHYFPTKLDVLVALLESGGEATGQQLRHIEQHHRGLAAVIEHARGLEAELADEHYAGFARAVAGVLHVPQVATAVEQEAATTSDFHHTHLHTAAAQGELRDDVPVESLVRWLRWLLDGAAQEAVDGDVGPGELPRAVRALLEPRR